MGAECDAECDAAIPRCLVNQASSAAPHNQIVTVKYQPEPQSSTAIMVHGPPTFLHLAEAGVLCKLGIFHRFRLTHHTAAAEGY
jgi:hypothetical protein